jgi:hypothetical protein
VSLNPGKLQKIERIKQVLKRCYWHNWVANHGNATNLKNARPDAEVLSSPTAAPEQTPCLTLTRPTRYWNYAAIRSSLRA